MYWRSTKRDLSVDTSPENSTDTHETDDVKNVTKRSIVDGNAYDRTKYHSELNNQQDISAGELYKSLETMLVE